MMELYSDIVDKKKVSLKRLGKSCGWHEWDEDAKGWNVEYGDGSGMVVDEQADAEMLSILLQIHERLKRIEKKLEII